jgi:DNA-binding NtrC family response regulator
LLRDFDSSTLVASLTGRLKLQKSGGLRIFVVDDERVIAETLAAILRQSGFIADAFINPLKALSSADSDPPGLLLSDVMMPKMSGIDLAIELRKRHPECRVLLFSGQAATVGLLSTARQQGYDFEVMLKPVHPKDLLAAITRTVSKPDDCVLSSPGYEQPERGNLS